MILINFRFRLERILDFDEEFLAVFKQSIYEHGKHIITNLEWYPELRSNHYLSNIVGLIYVSAYLPDSIEIESWMSFAVKELISEFENQFHPDGSNFEGSTSYHRLSGELVIYATLLILAIPNYSYQFPSWYIERLKKVAEFTIDITHPNGLTAQIGDNDSGRLFKLFPIYKKYSSEAAKERYCNLSNYDEQINVFWVEEVLDHRHLVAAINTLFEDQKFTEFASDASIESGLLKPRQTFPTRSRNTKEGYYPDFGLYIYRLITPDNIVTKKMLLLK